MLLGNEVLIFNGTIFVFLAVMCPPLSNVENGHVQTSQGLSYLSTAVYQCDVNHSLSGSPMRVCTAAGVWDRVQPTCHGGFTNFKHLLKKA